MTHVIATYLTGRIGQTVREHVRIRQEQQPRCLDRVTGHANHAGCLTLFLAVFVEVDNTVDQAFFVVGDAHHMRLRTQVQITRCFGLGDFSVERRPFGTAFAALETKAQLHATATTVTRLAVDGHVPCMHFFVAQLFGTGVHDFEVVVAGQTGDAIGTGHAHFVFSFGVVRLEFFERHRPIQQVGTLDFTVNGFGTELMLL